MRYASVCDGIGAAHVAWRPLGWKCAWTSEIEPFPMAVVEHRHGLANLGDMTAITEEMLDEHGPVDLLVGGTPCQSFSVAGLRGGLADPRGNLALRFVQLAAVMQPKWIVWENVPGVLSSNKGRDFGTFLRALGQLGYGFAYRVLDAQWFGVAQRRRRVFVVGYFGDWRRAAAVLFERKSVFGNPPTRGAKGQEATGSAGDGVEGRVTTAEVAAPITASFAKHHGRTAGNDGQPNNMIIQALTARVGASGPDNLATPFTKSKRAQSNTDDETCVPGEVSPTMSCFDQGDTRATTVVCLAETIIGQKAKNGVNGDGWQNEHSYTLSATGVHDAVCMASGQGGAEIGHSRSPTLTCNHEAPIAAHQHIVRRLTPVECERLQGFPDDYTAITYRSKPAADTPRYKAIGNSMAVPVMRWIGERIAMVNTFKNQGAA